MRVIRVQRRLTRTDNPPTLRGLGLGGIDRRRGLAPLELVLSLPLLLFLMALLIDFGSLSTWKVRTQVAARQAVWRQRGDRRGASDPPIANWPRNATLGVAPSPPDLFPTDPYAQYIAVRGPVLRDPRSSGQGAQLLVDTNKLALPGGLEDGLAVIDRNLPLLPKLTRVNFNVRHALLEGQWQFWTTTMRYGSNTSRRGWSLYQFVPPADVQQLANEFRNAALAIVNDSNRPDLDPLDRDQELVAWYGPPPRDFHPRLETSSQNGCTDSDRCSLNPQEVRFGSVQRVIDRIQGPRGGGRGGVPERMARAWISMYQAQKAQLEAQQPPPQAQIDQLQSLIDQLNQFIGTLN